MRWPRGGGSAPSALLRAAASAGLGGPGGAGRGLQPPVQSGPRSAAPQAFGRTEERVGERSRGAIEVAKREGRGARRVELRPLPPGPADIGERGRRGPRALQRPARAGGRGRGGHELCGVPGAERGARGAHWSLLMRGSQPAAGNFTREGTAGRAGRCKLSGGRGTLGIAARASGWRRCPRLLCVTSGPGPRVHPARPRGSPPSPQPGPGGRARLIVCIPRVTPGRERF